MSMLIIPPDNNTEQSKNEKKKYPFSKILLI
jgi:hypothetical protein